MSTMPAVVRSTPSFALPATQNTAPVHEFRCLYTHDIRKKAKKWHDGSARFHTFNKRVMVYDDTKNYIGDLHYRGDEDFGEGIELQLDRGVLIEIGERIGETQTDLTGIIHRQHAEVSNTPVTPGHFQQRSQKIQRIDVLNGLGRPKSLTEVLGPSQRQRGRATIPIQSPFEQRLERVNLQKGEPPKKKQKVVSGKENQTPERIDQDLSCSAEHHSVARYSTLDPDLTRIQRKHHDKPARSRNRPVTEPKVIDISSDDDGQTLPQDSSMTTADRESPTQRQLSRLSKDALSNNPRFAELASVRIQSSKPAENPSRPTGLAAIATASFDYPSKPRTARLRIASREPRKKLMYCALLPSANSTGRTTTDLAVDCENSNPDLETIGRQKPALTKSGQPEQYRRLADQGDDDVSTKEIFRCDELEDLASPTRSMNAVMEDQEIQERPKSPNNSPLFVSQPQSQMTPCKPLSQLEDDFEDLLSQKELSRESSVSSSTQMPQRTQKTEDEISALGTESPVFPCPPAARSESVNQTLDTAQPTPLALPLSKTGPVKMRSFARSLSEHDSPLPIDTNTSPIPCPTKTKEALPLFRPFPPSTIEAPNTSPKVSSLQRSASDTAAMLPTVLAPTAPNFTDQTNHYTNRASQGPWTTLEAFLLFDKWPHCKQKEKPVFEPFLGDCDIDRDVFGGNPNHDDDNDDDDDNNNVGMRYPSRTMRAPPVLIRSARSVLRDEY